LSIATAAFFSSSCEPAAPARTSVTRRFGGCRGALVAAFVAALLVAGVVTLPQVPAAAGTDPEGLLRRARDASATTTVAGIVEVRWRDGSTVHVEHTGARARAGSYVVGRDKNIAVGVGALRWSADDGVATRWGRVDAAEPPAPGAVWNLRLRGTAEVAHRPARIVVARHGDGPVRARFFVDEASGILLRRDVLAPDGRLDRSVRFTRVTTGDIRPAVPPLPHRGAKATSTDDVGGDLLAPEQIGGGFRLLGRYQHPEGAVQLFYSDGLFSLSVFEQPGLVDWGSLPDGGTRGAVDSEQARWYATDAGSVVVWGRDGLVLTGVSDAPPDTVRHAVSAIAAGGRGIVDDVVDFVLQPFTWD
jgi:hypothetical protein